MKALIIIQEKSDGAPHKIEIELISEDKEDRRELQVFGELVRKKVPIQINCEEWRETKAFRDELGINRPIR